MDTFLQFNTSSKKGRNEIRTPSKADCFQLMDEMEMMLHIVAHSIQVCRVAALLTDQLTRSGFKLKRNLVVTSALLHDITKTRSFETGELHAKTGGELLDSLGFPEVGEIIRQHVRLDRYHPSARPSEAEIVNYADKRVTHDKIVSLDERMAYILERYGKKDEDRKRLEKLWKKTAELEKKLVNTQSIKPEDIRILIKQKGYDIEFSL